MTVALLPPPPCSLCPTLWIGQGKATFARALGAAELQTLEITSCMLVRMGL